MTRFSSTSTEELIRACVESTDGAAWEEFVSRFQQPISVSVLRTARQWGEDRRQVIDDLIQETFLKLCTGKCRSLLDFATRHPEGVSGYIRTVAINLVHDHFKSLNSQKRGAGYSQESLENVEPRSEKGALGSADATERQILLKQIDHCLSECLAGPDRERDRLIFWLYYQQGMSAKTIAALPAVGLTSKGVESAIFRLTKLVREQIVGMRSQGLDTQPNAEKGFRPAESY